MTDGQDCGTMPTPRQDRGSRKRRNPLDGHALIIDTREQTPLVFPGPISTRRGTLRTGDYSLGGYEDRFTVERKSAVDLVGTLTRGRSRFERELERMAGYEFARVIVERPFSYIAAGRFGVVSLANPKAILGSVAAFEVRYGVPFVFAGDRAEAARRVIGWARAYLREKQKAEIDRLSERSRDPGAGCAIAIRGGLTDGHGAIDLRARARARGGGKLRDYGQTKTDHT